MCSQTQSDQGILYHQIYVAWMMFAQSNEPRTTKYHWIPPNTMQYHRIPYSTMQYECNTSAAKVGTPSLLTPRAAMPSPREGESRWAVAKSNLQKNWFVIFFENICKFETNVKRGVWIEVLAMMVSEVDFLQLYSAMASPFRQHGNYHSIDDWYRVDRCCQTLW